MALSYVYAAYGNVPVVVALFFGLKAAVLAIVLEAVVRIGKRALKNNVDASRSRRPPSSASSSSTSRFPIIIFGAGADRLCRRLDAASPAFRLGAGHGDGKQEPAAGRQPARRRAARTCAPDRRARAASRGCLARALACAGASRCWRRLGSGNVFSEIAVFFSKMAMVTFGGAYAVLAYVAQQAVETLRLAQARRDARRPRHGGDDARPADHGAAVRRLHGAPSAIPGSLPPMLAGTLGGLLATWVTFTPCFLWIFLGAPFIEVLRGNKALNGALVGDHRGGRRRDPQSRDLVRAAYAVPRRLPSGLWPGVRYAGAGQRRPWALALSAAAIVAIFRFKVGMIGTLLGCSATGVALFLAGWIS